MMKYNIVLMAAEHERLIEALRGTGLVDITTSGWEATEADRALLLDIEGRKKALDVLDRVAAEQEGEASKESAQVPAGEVYATYLAAQGEIVTAKSEIARLQKLLEEWTPWGDFSVETLTKLAEAGVVLRYFVAQGTTYDKSIEEWMQNYNISLISKEGGMARFVVLGDGEQEVNIDAQELKAPQISVADACKAMNAAEKKIEAAEKLLAACALSRSEVASELAVLKTRLQNVRIAATAERAADDVLMVLEGWAEEATCEKVDALLEQMPEVVYLKAKPVEEDDTPVKLKNNRFARLFELIGGMYALPKYGTLDLTPFFGPFYMLFFAICLNDAGYGALLLAAGLALYFKGGEKLKKASLLTIVCGTATTLFGFYSGSLFGMSIPALMGYEAGEPTPFLDFQNDFFSIALAIGVLQIMFGMAINIVMKIRLFGLLSALPLTGWFLVLLSGVLAAGLPMMNEAWTIPFFTTSSVAFYVAAGVGLALMLLFNGKNPILSILSGLWDTYNNITGLLSDVLSYIRLFAIGLSGGVLAQVFNQLALGLTGLDAGVESFTFGTIFQILGATAILFVGHGINLFMSAISSFVHPMRLTFVEFYKNAGFEMGTRAFEPLKDEINN